MSRGVSSGSGLEGLHRLLRQNPAKSVQGRRPPRLPLFLAQASGKGPHRGPQLHRNKGCPAAAGPGTDMKVTEDGRRAGHAEVVGPNDEAHERAQPEVTVLEQSLVVLLVHDVRDRAETNIYPEKREKYF